MHTDIPTLSAVLFTKIVASTVASPASWVMLVVLVINWLIIAVPLLISWTIIPGGLWQAARTIAAESSWPLRTPLPSQVTWVQRSSRSQLERKLGLAFRASCSSPLHVSALLSGTTNHNIMSINCFMQEVNSVSTMTLCTYKQRKISLHRWSTCWIINAHSWEVGSVYNPAKKF